jgi:predicted HAD superfamily Cof-like phosphohydrolase
MTNEPMKRSAPVEALVESHTAWGLPINTTPTIDLSPAVVEMRCALIEEEAAELRDALAAGDIVEVADAIVDLLYVVYGAGVTFGIPVEAVFAEVHRSNMTKLGPDGAPIYRADGKVLKGPQYEPPDILGVLERFAPDQATVTAWRVRHDEYLRRRTPSPETTP